MVGTGGVARLSVSGKMFRLISVGLSMFLGPLWPAYGEAIAGGDVVWVRKTLVRSMVTAVLLAAFAAAILVTFGPEILRFWVHRPISPPFSLLLGLGLWSVMDAAGVSVAMFLNGTNVLLPQVIVASIFSAVFLWLKIFLLRRLGMVRS